MIEKPALTVEPKINAMKIKDAGNMTINELKIVLERACLEYGLDVIVDTDVVTSGRLFDKSTIPCVVIKNAQYPFDYFQEVVTLKTQGIYAFVDVYYTGRSKNIRRIAAGNTEHKTMTGSIIGAIKKAMVSNDAIDEENNYYEMLTDAIESVF